MMRLRQKWARFILFLRVLKVKEMETVLSEIWLGLPILFSDFITIVPSFHFKIKGKMWMRKIGEKRPRGHDAWRGQNLNPLKESDLGIEWFHFFQLLRFVCLSFWVFYAWVRCQSTGLEKRFIQVCMQININNPPNPAKHNHKQMPRSTYVYIQGSGERKNFKKVWSLGIRLDFGELAGYKSFPLSPFACMCTQTQTHTCTQTHE